MKDEFEYNGVRMTDFNLIKNLEALIGGNAYEIYSHCDDNLWLGDDGKIYEFEYIPCKNQYIREFDNLEIFKKDYTK